MELDASNDVPNWAMIGHEWAVNLLRKHIARGEVRHAYLFSGPEGVGRRTLALRLAQALNCPQPLAPGEPCRHCRVCMQIERMQHVDLALIQAEQRGGTLKVDQIRELQRALSLHPYEARFRVAILLRFEEAHPSAMNALLKTLEEPAAQVVLALTAESAESLLPTIVSRCEVLRLRPVPIVQIDQALKDRWRIPSEQARLLAHISGGCPGYALRLHHQPALLEQRQACLEDQMRLLSADRVERFAYAESLSKDREALRVILSVWLTLWRDILLQASRSSASPANPDRQEEIKSLAEQFGLQTAHRSVSALERTLKLVDRNINLRLAVEVLMLDLPHVS